MKCHTPALPPVWDTNHSFLQNSCTGCATYLLVTGSYRSYQIECARVAGTLSSFPNGPEVQKSDAGKNEAVECFL